MSLLATAADRTDQPPCTWIKVRLMLTAMFVPIRHVEKYWHDVVKPMVTSEVLLPLIDYMDRTWIGELGGEQMAT
jgi:hypothetical protein